MKLCTKCGGTGKESFESTHRVGTFGVGGTVTREFECGVCKGSRTVRDCVYWEKGFLGLYEKVFAVCQKCGCKNNQNAYGCKHCGQALPF